MCNGSVICADQPMAANGSSPDTEEAIVAECARASRLWEDPHFLPPPGETWRRPSEIYGSNTAIFAADGIPPGGVCLVPGAMGDGWLMGALATLASRRPGLLQRLFVSVRGREFGVYTLQIFIGEAWVPLTIDDRLPCDADGTPTHAQTGSPGEIWAALVEKAWAKLLGGYSELRLGYVPHALRGLTGGVPLALPIDASRAAALAADAGSSPPDSQPSSPRVKFGANHAPAILTWERLRDLVGGGAPLALVRVKSATGESAGSGSEDLLEGLPYPIAHTREGPSTIKHMTCRANVKCAAHTPHTQEGDGGAPQPCA